MKRTFDLILSFFLLLIAFPILLVAFIVASLSTKSFGIYSQRRIGRKGRIFKVYKVKTMIDTKIGVDSTMAITSLQKKRITPIGAFLRKYKIDELPQLYNVLIGDMSFVGPRPDVPGYADKLEGKYRQILELRPGITGPASIKYANEEEILDSVDNPKKYNDEVIWPDKVEINYQYFLDNSIIHDLKLIIKTVKR
ncbi:sugar transferase [Brumimicrobium sp.]|uniref:sugar transferase n=1 Tax=Brumimicrobium sp. TaxID=2029867 RepID=UPI003A8E59F8